MKIENETKMKTYALHWLSTIGLRLKVARERRGISAIKMAEISFCDETTIEAIEQGDENTKLADVIKVLTALYLDKEVQGLACPGDDDVGLLLEKYFRNPNIEVSDKFDF